MAPVGRILALGAILVALVLVGLLLKPAASSSPVVPAAIFLSSSPRVGSSQPSRLTDVPGVKEIVPLHAVETFETEAEKTAAPGQPLVPAPTRTTPEGSSQSSPATSKSQAPESVTTEPTTAPSTGAADATTTTAVPRATSESNPPTSDGGITSKDS